MRWTLSLTAISGKPTRTVFGRPVEASTSASTGTASIPTRAKVFSLASMSRRPRGTGRQARTNGSHRILYSCIRRRARPQMFSPPLARRSFIALFLRRMEMQDETFDGELAGQPDSAQRHDDDPCLDAAGHPDGQIPRIVLAADVVVDLHQIPDVETDDDEDGQQAGDARQQPQEIVAARGVLDLACLGAFARARVVAAV